MLIKNPARKPKKLKNVLKPYALGICFFCFIVFIVAHGIGKIAQPGSGGSSDSDATEVVQAAHQKIRVGVQAGHWNTDQLPQELSSLWWNGGASAVGYNEVDVNLDIARKVKSLLEDAGVAVDLLPATVPEDYKADAFVAIHADGNDDTSVFGYKVAPTEWDETTKSSALSDDVIASYAAATGMEQNLTITDDMTQYYAFNFNRFHHTIDPTTPAIIVETGFITNYQDRLTIIKAQDKAAQGIADGMLNYLKVK